LASNVAEIECHNQSTGMRREKCPFLIRLPRLEKTKVTVMKQSTLPVFFSGLTKIVEELEEVVMHVGYRRRHFL
jgi:hypothetical protein